MQFVFLLGYATCVWGGGGGGLDVTSGLQYAGIRSKNVT